MCGKWYAGIQDGAYIVSTNLNAYLFETVGMVVLDLYCSFLRYYHRLGEFYFLPLEIKHRTSVGAQIIPSLMLGS